MNEDRDGRRMFRLDGERMVDWWLRSGQITEEQYAQGKLIHACSLCGKPTWWTAPVRSVFPRSPVCRDCGGPPSPNDVWGEFGCYRVDERIPRSPEAMAAAVELWEAGAR